MRYALVPMLLLALAAVGPATAAEPSLSPKDSGDAAHLFGYYIDGGKDEQFEAGYRKHLQWHQDHADPLVWYGWYVTQGERMGMFIDGTFGAPFSALDHRVSPAEDGRNADATFIPFVKPAARASYRLRRELSTGTPLEQWQPARMMLVTRYRVKPGHAARFEAALREMAKAQNTGGKAKTWYEAVAGTDVPEYMLMEALAGWETLGEADMQRPDQRSSELADTIESATNEVWTYQADLSLIPTQAGG